MERFFKPPLIPRAVCVHELKFLTLKEQRRFGVVSRECRALSEEVTRLTESVTVGYLPAHRESVFDDMHGKSERIVEGVMALVTRGQLRKLRSVTFTTWGLSGELFDALMRHCPQLKHLVFDAVYHGFVCARCCVCCIVRAVLVRIAVCVVVYDLSGMLCMLYHTCCVCFITHVVYALSRMLCMLYHACCTFFVTHMLFSLSRVLCFIMCVVHAFSRVFVSSVACCACFLTRVVHSTLSTPERVTINV